MNLKSVFHTLGMTLLTTLAAEAQRSDLAVVHHGPDEITSHKVYTMEGMEFRSTDAFRARDADVNTQHPHLTVSGDFTGDGIHEIAYFEDFYYTPNLNPDFTVAGLSVYRSDGKNFIPSGTWFSASDTLFDFAHVDLAVAADFNRDGFDDIAMFYNDHASDQLSLYVLESDGVSFSELKTWYSCQRTEFNFTALKFALAGDFNGNSLPDIAVFYNYFGTAPDTRQAIFLFESLDDHFELLPAAYDASKAAYDFSDMHWAQSGYFNPDSCTDIAVIMKDPGGTEVHMPVFEGSVSAQLTPVLYKQMPATELDLDEVSHTASGEFAGSEATDLALFYNNPGSGNQEILVLENAQDSLLDPVVGFYSHPDSLHFSNIAVVVSGTYAADALVAATTWQGDRKGAVSFTFDDGYRGAFEHGAAELEAADLKGTFYIFTDTTLVYYGELASTSLIREYKDKGHEIASHTTNHADLGLLTEMGDVDSIVQVLSGSVEILDQRYDQYTMTMSIPFGSFRLETLRHLADYFYSARSSQHGFNLATPFDFHALRSWPVVSTTSPAFVDGLLSTAEHFGTYLSLMYHDMLDEPFDEDVLIYTYSRELFRQTLLDARDRDLWIDTHARIYKYIRERNALRITVQDGNEVLPEEGKFHFTADDGLSDTIFNVPLTLKITLPQAWAGDTVTVGPEDGYSYLEVRQDGAGRFVLYDWLPVPDVRIQVHEGIYRATGFPDPRESAGTVELTAFPNPFQEEARIRVSGTSILNSYLIIRDIHGRVVQEIRELHGDSFLLSRASLHPGIYVVQLVRNGKALAALKLLAL